MVDKGITMRRNNYFIVFLIWFIITVICSCSSIVFFVNNELFYGIGLHIFAVAFSFVTGQLLWHAIMYHRAKKQVERYFNLVKQYSVCEEEKECEPFIEFENNT